MDFRLRSAAHEHTHTCVELAQRRCAGGKEKKAHRVRVQTNELLILADMCAMCYTLVYGSSRYTREKWMNAL